MELIKLAEDRYSCRQFNDKKVEKSKIDKLLRVAQLAPTACNNQPCKLLVIESEKALETLQKCKLSHFNEQLAILISYDENECWKRAMYDNKESGDIDAAIVTTHIMLEAEELGLGSTWVMNFNPEAIRSEFDLDENIIPVALLVIGYPSDEAKPSPRHSIYKEIKDFTKTI